MADLLNTAVSGLMAFQRSLHVTSHNISNVNTPGYSVQRADLMTRQAEQSGAGWIGNGVKVSTVTRSYDDFLADQVRTSSSSLSHFDTFATQAGRVNNLFGDSTSGLSATLQNFINAVQAVASTPTSIPARQTLLSQAQTLTDRMQGFDDSLQSFDTQLNSQLGTEADTISQLAQNIAQLNQQIVAAKGASGQPPNDLLDQRDHLLDQLAQHVSVDTVPQDDGAVNVFIGNGQSLVIGQTPAKLTTGQDPFDATRRVVLLQTATGSVDVTQNLSGGSLGGLLDFRTQVLDPARNTLGRLSVGLASVVNAQHNEGLDLNGNLGANFFAVGAVGVHDNANNTGTGTVAVTRSNVGALTTSDYVLRYTGTGWAMQRSDTGAAVTLTGTGTALDPFVGDGLSIVVGGTPVAGDRYLIQPTRSAVSGLTVLIDDPTKIAAATPIVGSAAAANTGSARISSGEVLNAANPQLQTATTINFQDATHYTVNGGATVFNYTSGANIDINGWRVQITGTPVAGDSFSVKANTNGAGDNRNALKLADVLNQPVLNGGTASLSAVTGQFVASIGVATNQAQSNRDAQQIVYNDGISAQQGISGVNLDEEAANLLRYQQAYQAAAQVIKIADTLFQTLIDSTGG